MSKSLLGRFAAPRAVFAVVFFVLCGIQPGFFAAANATGLHGNQGIGLATAESSKASDHHQHQHHEDHGAEADVANSGHHGSDAAGDKSCEVHCAPATAVPVECPAIEHVTVARCFLPLLAETVPAGQDSELIKPPIA